MPTESTNDMESYLDMQILNMEKTKNRHNLHNRFSCISNMANVLSNIS